MKTEITLAEVAGKTIEKMGGDNRYTGFASGEQWVVTFTDGTFITLSFTRYDGDVDLKITELDELEFGRAALLHFGLVTQEEFDERDRQKAIQRELEKQDEEQREFEMFKKLKAKFEGMDRH